MSNIVTINIGFDSVASCQEIEFIKYLVQVAEHFESNLTKEEMLRGSLYFIEMKKAQYAEPKTRHAQGV